jgi:hypothetical protein
MLGESEITNTKETAMALNGKAPVTQGKADIVTVETILPLNDPNRACMYTTVEKATTLNDPSRSRQARPAETLEPNGELERTLVNNVHALVILPTQPRQQRHNLQRNVILQQPHCRKNASIGFVARLTRRFVEDTTAMHARLFVLAELYCRQTFKM